jgi:hypothetical protein
MNKMAAENFIFSNYWQIKKEENLLLVLNNEALLFISTFLNLNSLVLLL